MFFQTTLFVYSDIKKDNLKMVVESVYQLLSYCRGKCDLPS